MPSDDYVPKAFEAEFDALWRRAREVAFRVVGEDMADDVAQDVMIRAHADWEKVEPYARAWVTRSAVNLAIGRWRSRKRRRTVSADELLPIADPKSQRGTDVADLRDELVRALRALPKRQREVAALRYLADMTELEIADTLGVAPGSVKKSSSRALEALRARRWLDQPPPGLDSIALEAELPQLPRIIDGEVRFDAG